MSVSIGLKSLKGDVPVTLKFINNGVHELQIRWVDYSGKERAYSNLAPRREFTQKSYASHPWRAYNLHTGVCVREFVANSKDFTIVHVCNCLYIILYNICDILSGIILHRCLISEKPMLMENRMVSVHM